MDHKHRGMEATKAEAANMAHSSSSATPSCDFSNVSYSSKKRKRVDDAVRTPELQLENRFISEQSNFQANSTSSSLQNGSTAGNCITNGEYSLKLLDLKVASVTDSHGQEIEEGASVIAEHQMQRSESADPLMSKRSAEKSNFRSSAARLITEADAEGFFSQAEKEMQQKFVKKYNYDVVADRPLEGRYEWIRLTP